MKFNRFTTYSLLTILVLAAVVRLYRIEQPFIDIFSWRQTSTAMMADNFYRRNWNIFYPEISWDGAGPSYNGREFQTVSYLAALLYTVFGQQDWIGRSIALIFGVWGIFALYQLVRRIWDEERALASAAVMALLPGSIFIERSFLPDPAMVSLITTSLWLFVVYLQSDRSRYLVLTALIFVWGVLTKLPGLAIGIPMVYAMFAILKRNHRLTAKKFLTIGIAGGIALIPIVAYYLWARYLALNYPPYHFAGSGNWLWDDSLQEWFSMIYFLPDLAKNAYYWLWSEPVILLILLGLVLPLLRTDNGKLHNFSSRFQAPWLFHWWFLAGVIYYLIGAKQLNDNPWNFHFVNPAVAAIAGHATIVIASYVKQTVRLAGTKITVAVAILIVVGISGQSLLGNLYDRSYGDESYRLGLALQQVSQPGDLVVTMASDLGDPNALYYSSRRGWVFPPASNEIDWSILPEDDNESIEMFESLRDRGADWLGIANEHQNLKNEHPKLYEHLKRTCRHYSNNEYGVICRILPPKKVTKP